jgi:hypothetical protein
MKKWWQLPTETLNLLHTHKTICLIVISFIQKEWGEEMVVYQFMVTLTSASNVAHISHCYTNKEESPIKIINHINKIFLDIFCIKIYHKGSLYETKIIYN